MSSRRSGGVRSITRVKLTTSLAAVRPAMPASSTIRAGRDRLAAAAAPSIAPRALAPASPSIARSARSSGSSASAAQAGPASARQAVARAAPLVPAASSEPPASATLIARPGRRSKRLSRFAPPAVRPVLSTTSAGDPPSSAAADSPAEPMPAIFTAPLVTWPLARAPR